MSKTTNYAYLEAKLSLIKSIKETEGIIKENRQKKQSLLTQLRELNLSHMTANQLKGMKKIHAKKKLSKKAPKTHSNNS